MQQFKAALRTYLDNRGPGGARSAQAPTEASVLASASKSRQRSRRIFQSRFDYSLSGDRIAEGALGRISN
jgi:hypothetical protein